MGDPGGGGAAHGINISGQVVGNIGGDYAYYPHAFLWDPATGVHDLGTFGSNGSVARAINQAGQVVGWRQNLVQTSLGTYLTETHGYIYDSATGTTTLLSALPGDTASRALDI